MSPEAVAWIGTICSFIGAAIAFAQAIRVKNYAKQIRIDIRKRNVMRSAESMRNTLALIRQLPTDYANVPRGNRVQVIIGDIKGYFDDVLGVLTIDGDDQDVREYVLAAQKSLQSYEHHFNGKNLSAELSSDIQIHVQNAVSLANDRVLKIEGK